MNYHIKIEKTKKYIISKESFKMKNKLLIIFLTSISTISLTGEKNQNKFNVQMSSEAKIQNILNIIKEGVIIFSRNMLCFFRDPNISSENKFIKNNPFGRISKINSDTVEVEILNEDIRINVPHVQIIEVSTFNENSPF